MTAQRHRIRAGMGGWKFPAWRGLFYPPGLAQKNELNWASRHVSAIEINSTFYAAQRPATYARWRSETPDAFVFSLKAPRLITQGRVLADAGRRIQSFVFGGLAELGDRLGPISWQFAPTRTFDPDDLAAFLDLLPADLNGYPLRHVLEVRHDSFMCRPYVKLARAHRVPTVFTDSPDYPSFADITGDFIYARLMRSKSSITSGYPAAQLKAWATRASTWAKGQAPADLPYVESKQPKAKARDVFVYFISAAKQRNPAAAMALMAQLDR